MVVILLGPPGSGKGTQAERIKNTLNVPHISTGDMLREAIKNNTPIGKEVKQYLDSGKLVPDETIINMISERISKADCKDGFLLDGFPRTINQAKGLDSLLKGLKRKIDKVINLAVSEDVLIERLSGRRSCAKCGTPYHVAYKSPKKENTCDRCTGQLYQRDDDKPETIKNRFQVYQKQTAPLLDYYKDVVININGNQNIELISKNIASVIQQC
jgi:adenylate kinase